MPDKSDEPQTTEAEQLITNIAEAEAYSTGFVDGVMVALQLRLQDLPIIQARCARARELDDG